MAIRLIDVDFTYRGDGGEREILRRFSLTLPERGIVCLSGPSGCGKTTLLRLLAGLEEPEGGRIEGLAGLRPAMVFQEDRLLPWCSALENVALAAGGDSPKETAARWLRMVELEGAEALPPAQLSGGMKRRVAIARALASPAELLLLDEPFTGLDRPLWSRIARRLAPQGSDRHKEQGGDRLVVAVTHLADEAEALSARRIFLDGPPLAVAEIV